MPFHGPHSYFSRKYWHEHFEEKRRKEIILGCQRWLAKAYSKATTQEQFRAIANLAESLDVELKKEG